MTEGTLLRDILVRLSSAGLRMFRNNVGQTPHKCPHCKQRQRVVRYGLCVGSSDIIGWQTVEIRAEDVGRRVAVFTAIEVKTKNVRATHPQRRFIHAVLQAGGLAGVARSEEEALSVTRWGDREPIQETL